MSILSKSIDPTPTKSYFEKRPSGPKARENQFVAALNKVAQIALKLILFIGKILKSIGLRIRNMAILPMNLIRDRFTKIEKKKTSIELKESIFTPVARKKLEEEKPLDQKQTANLVINQTVIKERSQEPTTVFVAGAEDQQIEVLGKSEELNQTQTQKRLEDQLSQVTVPYEESKGSPRPTHQEHSQEFEQDRIEKTITSPLVEESIGTISMQRELIEEPLLKSTIGTPLNEVSVIQENQLDEIIGTISVQPEVVGKGSVAEKNKDNQPIKESVIVVPSEKESKVPQQIVIREEPKVVEQSTFQIEGEPTSLVLDTESEEIVEQLEETVEQLEEKDPYEIIVPIPPRITQLKGQSNNMTKVIQATVALSALIFGTYVYQGGTIPLGSLGSVRFFL